MKQIARNVTMAQVGFLRPDTYLIHDRDRNFCPASIATSEAVGLKPVKLPARSPNLNAHAERWVQSVKGESLSRLILFGEASLRRVLLNLKRIIMESETTRAKATSSSSRQTALQRGMAPWTTTNDSVGS
jgi:hypothetical protein